MGTFYKKVLARFVFVVLSCILYHTASAQNRTVTIEKDGITLNELLTEIRRQTNYDFVFTSSKIDFQKKINAKFRNASVVDILGQYFNPSSGVIHILKNQTIVLIDEEKAEYILLQGQVLNSTTKQPMAGVTVGIGEKNIHTKTDSKGNFSINVPEYAKALEFNYIGFKKLLIPITASIKYQVELEEKTEEIEDVVVTGIFNRNAESFTGASRTISGEELKKISANNIFAGISAIEPSFRMIANNELGGNINQLPDIQLRGQNSFPIVNGELSSNPNQPLFILDGFEVDLQRIVDLDMNRIASVTILKDASATAIYGSRGANGVMVINTIAPKPGKIQVSLTNDFRLSTPDLSVYNYLNAYEKLDFENRVGIYAGSNYQESYANEIKYNARLKNAANGIDTDWKSIPTQIGKNNRTSLNLQGGDEYLRYNLLAAADLQEGVMKGQTRDNYSAQFDLSYQVKKVQFRNSIRINNTVANESPYGNFSEYLKMNPYFSPYDSEGNVQQYVENLQMDQFRSSRVTNPLYDATLNSVNKTKQLGVTNNFQVKYNILSNLFIESNLSLNKTLGSTDQFFSAQDSRFDNIEDVNRKGSYTAKNDEASGYESLTNINYNFSKGKHQWISTASFNLASTTNEFKQIVAEGFPYDKLDNLLYANQYEENGTPTGDESTVRRVGMLYSGNYSYDNRFLFDVSIKRDGSSQYGTDKRFGNFWSTGIGWNIHNEKFFVQNEVVNRLKIRGSYGTAGSLNIPAYSAQTRYTYGVSNNYYNELGAVLTSLGNDQLSWQTVNKLNIGLDAVLFRERLDVRLDAYRDITQNALTTISLAPSTGFTSFSENLGKVQNDGFEFSARYKILENRSSRTTWSVFVNGYTNKNILKEISNRLKASNELLNENNDAQTAPNILFEEGQSMSTIYAVRSLGVDPATGSEIFLTKDGVRTFNWSASDKVAVGITDPKWNGNFGTNIGYKGFELGMIWSYQFGGQLYNQTLVDRVESVNPNENVDRRAYDLGWAKAGDISQFTRIGLSTVDTRVTSRFVQDNNILKLSSLSLGYNIAQQAWQKKIGVQSLYLSAITNDLLQFSSIEIERGTSNPFARTFSLSIRAGF
ncbi:SusC/RagA family TonB-linked outer membrane protein [Sphingobacterium sp. LRF_L2]|uniref:SusC/RagA family TonB-linked outer membrane protein n=1 Tax=Sphingobacterium sp. LRF_L2 TaxID=3369421 RepID=UPI003F604EEE